MGIDPKYQERVSVMLESLHKRSECSGTGIGLAICKKIVERHGGRIRFGCRPGEGATFLFTLPATGDGSA
jgi:light-regulated signal transduction histidine kinase (bacteriophytochrome)